MNEHQPPLAARARHPRRGCSRGQTLVIFVLALTVLIGLAGLVIDVLRVYDLYAHEQRAAEAAALAGVLYLPNHYNTAAPAPADGNSAASRAILEAVKNGYGTAPGGAVVTNPCPTPVSATEVAVCQVTGKPTQLQVTVSEPYNLVLLSVIGIAQVTVSASAIAEYLPPIQMGARSNVYGDQGECGTAPNIVACDPTQPGAHVQDFRADLQGPANLKEYGDAFVYCEEGSSVAPPANPSGSPYNVNGQGTNHQPYAGGANCGVPGTPPLNVGNPDQQPRGFDGPMTQGTAHPGAYNYAINTDQTNATVWVYHGNYVPTDIAPSLDHFQRLDCYGSWTQINNGCSGGKTYTGRYDDPWYYFNMTYTLYRVPLAFSRGNDVQIGTKTFEPYDRMSTDLANHGCAQLLDPSTLDCVTFANMEQGNCFMAWCQIGTLGNPGLYRLAIEDTGLSNTLNGWGEKDYALKVCPPGTTTATVIGCATTAATSIAAWNNMTVYFSSPNTSSYFDLANISAAYAGRTIQMSLFDPGDGSGSYFLRLVPPAGSGITVPVPPGINSGLDDTATNSINASNRAYNGRWVNTVLTLPANYAGGWWQIHYNVIGGTPSDTVTFKFTLIGSPLHLLA
jgi:Flp pilus assembly protein TadG